MVIPVLNKLSTREQWLDFCRREAPYCFVEAPECLIDFQSTFLKITLLPNHSLVHDAVKYSLGSRSSMEPVWRLIKSCNWNIQHIIQGLEEMDFSSNVRDNSLLKAHTDLSVRKYFSRERCLVSPGSLGLLEPLMAVPDIWSAYHLAQMITHGQYKDLRNEKKLLQGASPYAGLEAPDSSEIILILLDPVEQCIGQKIDGRLHIFRGKQPFISLIPELNWPKPRLKKSAS